MAPATTTEVSSVTPIGHAEAMALADTEAMRLLEVVDQLRGPDWARPTDCEGWDVKALLSHVLGAMEANARAAEFVHQFLTATRAAKRSGRPMVDEMTGRQVRDHARLSTDELTGRMHQLAARAVRGRRRVPVLLRAVPINPGAPIEGTWKLGYLVDVIMNRDYWMHRVDLTRATGRELVLSAGHDGRIVADVVAEWARAHGQPFTLVLEGPAGRSFRQQAGGAELRLDAVEFCRILSGRDHGPGLLTQKVPF
jgi:uncharacterized protein (TIGR03083 family)